MEAEGLWDLLKSYCSPGRRGSLPDCWALSWAQYHLGAVEWSWQDFLQKESVCFLPQDSPGPGDVGVRQAWVLVPEWVELAAVWYSGKNSGPGWLELGAVVGKVLDHSKGRYLCVQGFASLYLAARNFLDLERGISFNLTFPYNF